MKILILCALRHELDILNSNFDKSEKIGEYPFQFFHSKYKNLKIISAKCGLGKIRAAAFTQYCIDNVDFDLLVNFGSCGQIDDNVKIGDLVFCIKTVEYDFHTAVREFIPEFEVNHNIPDSFFKKFGIKKGILLTATQNVDSSEKKKLLKERFNGTVGDWEGSAIAQVCTLNNRKFFIFKVVTDRGDENLLNDYKNFFKKTLREKSKTLLDFLVSLNHQECL